MTGITDHACEDNAQHEICQLRGKNRSYKENKENRFLKETICTLTVYSIRKYVIDVFDFSLFLDLKFVFLFIGNIFGMIGFYIPIIYIVDRALLLSISSKKAAFLLSIIGKVMNCHLDSK